MADIKNLKFGTTVIGGFNVNGVTNIVKCIVDGVVRYHKEVPTVSISYSDKGTGFIEWTINNSSGLSPVNYIFRVSGVIYQTGEINNGQTITIQKSGYEEGTTSIIGECRFNYGNYNQTIKLDTARTTLAVPVQANIYFVSDTETTMSFRITNLANETCRVYWEHSDDSPDSAWVDLAAGVTSGTITKTGLLAGTSYTFYAEAKVISNSALNTAADSFTNTTDAPSATLVPSIHTVSNNPAKNWLSWSVKNLETSASVTIYTEKEDNTPDQYVRTSIAAQTSTAIVNDSWDEIFGTVTIYAKAQTSGGILSAYDSYVFTV